MSFKCFKTVFDQLMLSFSAFNTEIICKICIKYQYVSQTVCAYAHDFKNYDQGVRLLEHVR